MCWLHLPSKIRVFLWKPEKCSSQWLLEGVKAETVFSSVLKLPMCFLRHGTQCLYTNAYSMWNKWGYDLTGVTKMWWNNPNDWGVCDGKLFRKDPAGLWVEESALEVREQLECLEFRLWVSDESAESLWVSVLVAICCWLLYQEEADMTFFRQMKETSWGTSNTLILAGGTAQQGTSNTRGFWSALRTT